MTKKEVKILITLIDDAIEKYSSVFNRTNNDYWLSEINSLELIKNKLNTQVKK
jgi:hypothetical protein